MRKWISGAFFIALLAGCSSNPQQSAPVEERVPSTATTPGSNAGAVTGGTTAPGVGGTTTGSAGSTNPLRDPSNILSKRSVLFEYDSFTVPDQYRGIVEAHARYLQGNRNTRITIQGNADERGSREYNIALGQKRADAVRQLMRVLGVGDAQIETVSFGKEKPRNPGHDEAAWAENRRADIVYSGE